MSPRLSQPLSRAERHYEVLIAGSGYGGAVMASRLARAGRKVALLERGREIPPGAYPDSPEKILGAAQMRNGNSGQRIGPADALFDFRLHEDVSVLVGCGLGGTSLINANVALPADTRVMEHFNWPRLFRDDPARLEPYYARARAALGSTPYPEDAPPLAKTNALEQSARALGQPFYRPPVNVSFADGPNHFGFEQSACTLCGDCCSGCNYGAKNTTLMNYLPDARAFGAAIFTRAELRRVARDGDHWTAIISDGETGLDTALTATVVILAAGTLGSTEILMRSRENGLPVSPMLGQRFSGNGDVIAFGYNANPSFEIAPEAERQPIYGIGAGPAAPEGEALRPGPCIAGIIDMRAPDAPVTEGMVIQEGVMPGALALAYPAIFFMADALDGDPMEYPDMQARLLDAKLAGETMLEDPAALVTLTHSGPMARTQTFLVMSHDSSDGVLEFANDTVSLSWPGAGTQPSILQSNEVLRQASEAIWAQFAPNPLWQGEFGRKLITVHPIGGCAMADSPGEGVVNAWCQVFDPSDAPAARDRDGQGIHPGLYVCDGAVVPGALGVNPLLTISALAEHTAEALAHDRGWQIDYDSRRPLPPGPEAPLPEPAIAPQEALAEGLSALDQGMAALGQLRSAIDAGAPDTARDIAREAYEELCDQLGGRAGVMPSWPVVGRLFTDTNLQRIIAPVIDDVQPVLAAIRTRLGEGDYLGAFAELEAAVGDISPALSFSERMTGHVAQAPGNDGTLASPCAVAAHDGALSGDSHAMTGRFHVAAASIEELLADPGHSALLSGEITCPLAGGTLRLEPGARFQLMPEDAGRTETWQMIYEGCLTGSGGPFKQRRRWFRGVKTLRRRPGGHWWRDVTTLDVSIWDGPAPQGDPVLQGVLSLTLRDLADQAASVEMGYDENRWTLGAELGARLLGAYWFGDLAEALSEQPLRADLLKEAVLVTAAAGDPRLLQLVQLKYAADFGKFFALVVFRCHGGLLSYLKNFPALDDAARPVPQPAEARPAPQVHDVGPGARLTRHQGGTRGPVILAPGFSVAAASYDMDTAPSLTQTLCQSGYDVWLLDPRGSPAQPASRDAFTIDDIARRDWPDAVAGVRRLTGAADVQIVAHCFGAATAQMALLDGMEGVRSLIASQTGTHLVTNWLNYAKAHAYVPSLLMEGAPDMLDPLIARLPLPDEAQRVLAGGLQTVNLVPDPDPDNIAERTVDALFWQVPFPGEEPCHSPLCHRVFGFFGPSWRHAQLNEATHDALHRVFGTISARPFRQLAQMIRAGRLTDAQGQDSYLSRPQNIRVPVDYIAGSHNMLFLPETTLRSLDWLHATHPGVPREMFTRQVFSGYGHMDCFVGRHVHRDIFPYILERLAAREEGA